MPKPQQGFTLIEILVAVAIGLIVVLAITSTLPKLTKSSAEQGAEVLASTRVNKLTQTISQQFRTDSFAGFSQASGSRLTAVFTTGSAVPVPAQPGYLHTLSTLNLPGLNANPGREVLIVAGDGSSKLLTVQSVNGTNFTFNCATGMPSNVNVKVYPAQSVSLTLDGGQLSRTSLGSTTNLGPSQGIHFSYVYQDASGNLIRDPAGTPANQVSAGQLVGLLPVTIATTSQTDRSALIPLKPSNVKRVLACAASAVTTPNEGRLNLSIIGLPSGASPDVTLHGPDTSVNGQHPTASQLYTPIQPGTYSLSANPVTYQGVTYQPVISGSPSTLYNPWGDTYLQVRYTETYGTIKISTTGLPAGAGAPITLKHATTGDVQTVTLPTGYQASVKVSAGRTDITAATVTVSGVTYTPNPAATWADVNSGQTTAYVINYTPNGSSALGNIQFNISGLPNGGNPAITWTGPTPGNFNAVNGSTTVNNLQPGTYTVNPANSNVGTNTYKAAARTVTVTAGNTTVVNVNYGAGSGTINLTIQGLPANGSTTVKVGGPTAANISAAGNSTYAIENLDAGTYTLSGTAFGTFAAPSTTVLVNAGGTTNATLTFTSSAPTTGGIKLTIQGLTTTGPQVTMAGPQPTQFTVANSVLLFSDFPIGNYTLTMPSVGGQSPNPISVSIPVQAGLVTPVVIDYGGGNGGVEPPDPVEKCSELIRCMGEDGDGATLGAEIKVGNTTFGAGTSLDIDMGNGQTLRDFLTKNNPDYGDVSAMLSTVPDWQVGTEGADEAYGRNVPLEPPDSGNPDPTSPPDPTPPDPTPPDPGNPTPPEPPTPTPPDPGNPTPPEPICTGNVCIEP